MKNLSQEDYKYIAQQLRKPFGEHGIETGERLAVSNHELYQHVLNKVQAQNNDTILEIGMGAGHHVQQLIDCAENINYIGCDHAELMAKEAMRVNHSIVESGHATFHCGDVCQLEYPTSYFTKAFTVNTIYFWEDVHTGLQELYRVLIPGGHLHIAGRPKHIIQGLPFAAFGFQLYDQNELSHLYKQHGFRDIQIFQSKEEDRVIDGHNHAIESLIISGRKPD